MASSMPRRLNETEKFGLARIAWSKSTMARSMLPFCLVDRPAVVERVDVSRFDRDRLVVVGDRAIHIALGAPCPGAIDQCHRGSRIEPQPLVAARFRAGVPVVGRRRRNAQEHEK